MAGSKCGTSRRSISSANASLGRRRLRGFAIPASAYCRRAASCLAWARTASERLAEHMLIGALTSWKILDREGFNLQLAIKLPVSVLLAVPIPAIVDKHGPRSERWPGIIVEVTEDQIVRDMRFAQEIAGQLRTSGVDIAIDDFGAGYSSFSTLRGLPFTEIKLDESFVKNCATDATNAAICQTAIDLAHRFGSAAVAQGIKTAADMQALMVMGCDLGQGVLIGPAMPAGHFLALLRRRAQAGSAASAKGIDEHGDANAPIPDSTARYSSEQGSP